MEANEGVVDEPWRRSACSRNPMRNWVAIRPLQFHPYHQKFYTIGPPTSTIRNIHDSRTRPAIVDSVDELGVHSQSAPGMDGDSPAQGHPHSDRRARRAQATQVDVIEPRGLQWVWPEALVTLGQAACCSPYGQLQCSPALGPIVTQDDWCPPRVTGVCRHAS